MSTTPTTEPHPAGVQRVQLNIGGMSCIACAHKVKKILNKMPTVSATVNFSTRVATVEITDGITIEELCRALQQAGYQAEPRSARADGTKDPDSERLFRVLAKSRAGGALRALTAPLRVGRRRQRR